MCTRFTQFTIRFLSSVVNGSLCTLLLISDENGPYYWHIKSGTIQREAPVASPDDIESAKDANSSTSVRFVTTWFQFFLTQNAVDYVTFS